MPESLVIFRGNSVPIHFIIKSCFAYPQCICRGGYISLVFFKRMDNDVPFKIGDDIFK